VARDSTFRKVACGLRCGAIVNPFKAADPRILGRLLNRRAGTQFKLLLPLHDRASRTCRRARPLGFPPWQNLQSFTSCASVSRPKQRGILLVAVNPRRPGFSCIIAIPGLPSAPKAWVLRSILAWSHRFRLETCINFSITRRPSVWASCAVANYSREEGFRSAGCPRDSGPRRSYRPEPLARRAAGFDRSSTAMGFNRKLTFPALGDVPLSGYGEEPLALIARRSLRVPASSVWRALSRSTGSTRIDPGRAGRGSRPRTRRPPACCGSGTSRDRDRPLHLGQPDRTKRNLFECGYVSLLVQWYGDHTRRIPQACRTGPQSGGRLPSGG